MSDKMASTSMGYIILAISFQASAGVFGKYAAIAMSDPSPIMMVTNIFYLLSLVSLLLQALVWQQALMHYPLSFAYPFMSLVNFVILLFSAVLFGEGITITNIAGLCLISIGITMLSRERGRSKIHGDVRS